MLYRRDFVASVTSALALGVRTSWAAPSSIQTFRIAVADWVPGLGNPYASTMNGAIHPFAAIFDALTVIDADGSVQPNLAVSWAVDSPTQWTFKLRTGVNFANGEAADARAAAAMLMWLKQPNAQRYVLSGEVKGIAAVAVRDEQTLVITTHAPDALLPKRMSLLMLVPPAYWSKVGPDAFAQAPIGTGPFVLNTWGRDRGRVVLVANPSSWRPAKYLQRVEYIVLRESSSRTQALFTGEAEAAFNINFEGRELLAANGFPTLVRPQSIVAALALRANRPGTPLADVRVRQALNYAVDRATIAKVILNGMVEPSAQGVQPGVFGYSPDITMYPFQPDRARSLLREAGFGKGFKLVAAVLTRSAVEGEAIYQKIAQDLRQVGVTVEIRSVTGADWVKMWVTGEWREADMMSMVWNSAALMDAGQAIDPFACDKTGTFFCAAEVDKLIAASKITFEAKARERQLQHILSQLHDLAPSLYLFPQLELIGISPRLKTPTYRGRYFDWTTLQLDR